MNHKNPRIICLALSCLAGNAAAVITLEDLPFASGDVENGANLAGSETITNDPWADGSVPSQGVRDSSFTSGAPGSGSFPNTHTNVYALPDAGGGVLYDYWSGWAYSRTTDTTTSGFMNQYSAVAGGGAGGSSNYAVAFDPVRLNFGAVENFSGRGLFVTNTTYTHNTMRDGDLFAKQFGGAGGDEADWFLLTIEGLNGGNSTGSVDFYLADYRFADNGLDYLVDEWSFVDLSTLGNIDELSFSFSSSDTGGFGMNTPAYFALDNVGAIPEPSAALLTTATLLGMTLQRRRQTTPHS